MISRPICRADGLVVDTSAKISSAHAVTLKTAGVSAIFRYVFFSVPRPGDLDMTELLDLVDAGLIVMCVQHVRNPGWVAGPQLGTSDGLAAVANATKAGYVTPPGQRACPIALDLEGVRNPGADVEAHARSWIQVVSAGGYAPIIYVGYDCGLTSAMLDSLNVSTWCDYAALSARPSPTVGHVLHQKPQSTIAGVGVDVDDVLQDGVLYGLAAY